MALPLPPPSPPPPTSPAAPRSRSGSRSISVPDLRKREDWNPSGDDVDVGEEQEESESDVEESLVEEVRKGTLSEAADHERARERQVDRPCGGDGGRILEGGCQITSLDCGRMLETKSQFEKWEGNDRNLGSHGEHTDVSSHLSLASSNSKSGDSLAEDQQGILTVLDHPELQSNLTSSPSPLSSHPASPKLQGSATIPRRRPHLAPSDGRLGDRIPKSLSLRRHSSHSHPNSQHFRSQPRPSIPSLIVHPDTRSLDTRPGPRKVTPRRTENLEVGANGDDSGSGGEWTAASPISPSALPPWSQHSAGHRPQSPLVEVYPSPSPSPSPNEVPAELIDLGSTSRSRSRSLLAGRGEGYFTNVRHSRSHSHSHSHPQSPPSPGDAAKSPATNARTSVASNLTQPLTASSVGGDASHRHRRVTPQRATYSPGIQAFPSLFGFLLKEVTASERGPGDTSISLALFGKKEEVDDAEEKEKEREREWNEVDDGWGKTERVENFLSVPFEVEKIILFGFFVCLDSFLYNFTILPLRVGAALVQLVFNRIQDFIKLLGQLPLSNDPRKRRQKFKSRSLSLAARLDLVKALLFFVSCLLISSYADASRMYHSVRGQDTVKLYMIFNVLEVADRLHCSFGQDLLDTLFSRRTLMRRRPEDDDVSLTSGPRSRRWRKYEKRKMVWRPLGLFALGTFYVVCHTLILFYQLVTLNVAINSYSNALLTLLMSNQFVEIKGSVFKKFEKENLFQMTCADIVERFQLALLLGLIAARNMIELSGSSFAFLPTSFVSLSLPSLPTLASVSSFFSSFPPLSFFIPSTSTFFVAIFSPTLIVLLSECLVDWLKHAFITKFNHIRPKVYGRFVDVVCRDLVASNGEEGKPLIDQSPLVSRRLGFAALPLGCLAVRVTLQAIAMLSDDSMMGEDDAFEFDECGRPYSVMEMEVEGIKSRSMGRTGWWTNKGIRWAVMTVMIGLLWGCLIATKLLIGIKLRNFAQARIATMERRMEEDKFNDRNRPVIGIDESEKTSNKRALELINQKEFDDPDPGPKKMVGMSLDHLSRWDMVKSRLH